MAGVAGFEPTNDGIKNRCLTTWRHPNHLMDKKYCIRFFQKMQVLFLCACQQVSATEFTLLFLVDIGVASIV